MTMAAAAWPALVPANAHMLVASLCCVYAGAHLSLSSAGSESGGAERLGAGEAAWMPLVALGGLATLYLAFQFLSSALLNALLRSYAAALGAAAVGEALRPLVPSSIRAVARSARPLLNAALPCGCGRVRLSGLDVALFSVGVAVAGAYLQTGHWVANNAIGAAFAVQGIARLTAGRYSTAAALTGGLLVYDLLMVFYTPMMVDVATRVDAPIKLLFPTGEPDSQGRPGFSLLGLGDLVIPGVLLALLLRADAKHALRGDAKTKKAEEEKAAVAAEPKAAAAAAAAAAVAPSGAGDDDDDDDVDDSRAQALVFTAFPKPLFMTTWAAYAVGLMATIAVMHFFRHGQPALIYLIPATLTASALAACSRQGGWKALLDYDDEDYYEAVAAEPSNATVSGDVARAAAGEK